MLVTMRKTMLPEALARIAVSAPGGHACVVLWTTGLPEGLVDLPHSCFLAIDSAAALACRCDSMPRATSSALVLHVLGGQLTGRRASQTSLSAQQSTVTLLSDGVAHLVVIRAVPSERATAPRRQDCEPRCDSL